ncbi:hypothetical protein HZB88_04645 [archaeon]|nr:hypothetical protein [archaeon]
MKKIWFVLLVVALLTVSMVSAGFWDWLTGKATERGKAFTTEKAGKSEITPSKQGEKTGIWNKLFGSKEETKEATPKCPYTCGQKIFLRAGEAFTSSTSRITLDNIGSSSVVVSVEELGTDAEVTKSISVEELIVINGVPIYVYAVVAASNAANSWAVLSVPCWVDCSDTLVMNINEIAVFDNGATTDTEGNIITLDNVGSSSAVIDVDGTVQTISVGEEMTINGVAMKLINVISTTNLMRSLAIMQIVC